MIENNPLLSIIIPTYHRNDLLGKCLEKLSTAFQGIEAEVYEVVVTDDGKSVNAKGFVQQEYPWVRWVAGPQQGPAANRNNGAAHAKGSWLVFTDDDCLPEQGWLAAFLNAITQRKDVQVLEGKTVCREGIRSPLETSPINECGGLLWSCNMAVKTTFFKELQGFNTSFPFANMEDVDFRERIKKRNEPIIFVDKAVVDHPPRRMANGKKLASQHESNYYFWKILEKRAHVESKLFKEILKFRLRSIVHHRLSIDTLIAVFMLAQELYYTKINLYKWRRKYLN